MGASNFKFVATVFIFHSLFDLSLRAVSCWISRSRGVKFKKYVADGVVFIHPVILAVGSCVLGHHTNGHFD